MQSLETPHSFISQTVLRASAQQPTPLTRHKCGLQPVHTNWDCRGRATLSGTAYKTTPAAQCLQSVLLVNSHVTGDRNKSPQHHVPATMVSAVASVVMVRVVAHRKVLQETGAGSCLYTAPADAAAIGFKGLGVAWHSPVAAGNNSGVLSWQYKRMRTCMVCNVCVCVCVKQEVGRCAQRKGWWLGLRFSHAQ